MPDYIEPIQGQADWPAMLHDLEKRVEVLSDALEAVKLSMRRLVLAEPSLQQSASSLAPPALEAAYATPPEQPAAPEALPVYDDAPAYNFDAPVFEAAPPVEPAPSAAYDEDAREAVRRAVEEAKSQMASGDLREETGDFVSEDKPEVSWVTLPDDGREPEPLPVFEEPVTEEATYEDPREAVRRAVEEAKAELSAGSLSNEDATSQQPESQAGSENEEDPREAMRRAVEQAKADLGMPGYARPQFEAPAEMSQTTDQHDDEAAREAVRQAVEQAKAERAFAENAIGTLSEEEAAREAVRQAVAKARTEMATTGSIAEEEPEPVEKRPAFVVPPPHRPERVHPPTITIEDPEGRVELARVYNLLKRLDVAANSSLLNYSSRQVAVQLSDSKTAPEGDNVMDAVREVFERENDVSVDGLNVIVKLGNDYVQAA